MSPVEKDDAITANEARQLYTDAGLSVATFHRRVNAGLIESSMPEGRERGALYSRTQVLETIGDKKISRKPRKRKKQHPAVQLAPSTFGQATIEDMPEMATFLETFFHRISVPARTRWMEKNPEIAFILRSKGKIVGAAFLMPIEEQKILKILEKEGKPPTHPDDIPLYEPGKHYTLYIRSVLVNQSVSKMQRRHWAATLITSLIRSVVSVGERGIIVNKIYAQTSEKNVVKLLNMLGFSQMVSLTSNKNFVLDVEKSGAIFAMQYKNALDAWGEE